MENKDMDAPEQQPNIAADAPPVASSKKKKVILVGCGLSVLLFLICAGIGLPMVANFRRNVKQAVEVIEAANGIKKQRLEEQYEIPEAEESGSIDERILVDDDDETFAEFMDAGKALDTTPLAETGREPATRPVSEREAIAALAKFGSISSGIDVNYNAVEIDISSSRITDAGLVHLKELKKLESLRLTDTKITDAGLVHLKGLTKLRYLNLSDTQVTNAGVANLQKALPNCEILDADGQRTEQPNKQPPELDMTFNKIPAGTFMMGSPETEEGRQDDEHQHQVTITKPFYMQTTEVTQGQWTAVMGTEPWKKIKVFVKDGSNYPARLVTWDDTIAFCKKLSEKEGKTYRLPTEAEWEYACRAGSTTTWSFGNDGKSLGEYAWYDKNAWLQSDEKYAHQVGLKKPNAFGLYDMYGNVREWCSDYYEKDYYKQSPEKDPMGPASGSLRVYRGGEWDDQSRFTRSADRGRNIPIFRYTLGLGFRLVRELD